MAVYILMLGTVGGRSSYHLASLVAPCLPGEAGGRHWQIDTPDQGTPATAAAGVQVSVFGGMLSSTPQPPVSFYIGLFMQMVQELAHLALMLGAPATYSRHRTSLILAARLLFWLPPCCRGEGWPNLTNDAGRLIG